MKKLLIIDDEEMLTELLSDHFSTIGYLTFVANDTTESLNLLVNQPDLIFYL